MSSYQYKKSHSGDKTILRPSYLHNGISYTGKMTSLYWFSPQVTFIYNTHHSRHAIGRTRRWGVRCLMMTSSNGTIFRVTGPLCGEFTGPGEFPAQRPVTRSFDVFFDLRLNKRLSKQPWGWWFETPPWSLWRHCNVLWVQTVSDLRSTSFEPLLCCISIVIYWTAL